MAENKNIVFLAETGITDTKANNIANRAKLAYTELEEMLSSITFLDVSIETINGTSKKNIAYGIDDISWIEPSIERIGKLKSLCAWLREAIKAHQDAITRTNSLSFSTWLLNNGKYEDSPNRGSYLTEEEVIASLDIKERNRYLSLEAMSASIGGYIHKGGPIDCARRDLFKRMSNPTDTSGTGSDLVITTYTSSIDKDKVENVFRSLQKKHEKYQQELNAMKSEITSRILNHKIEVDAEYARKCSEYSDRMEKYRSEFEAWRSAEVKRVGKLKIVIPNNLKEIYDEMDAFDS